MKKHKYKKIVNLFTLSQPQKSVKSPSQMLNRKLCLLLGLILNSMAKYLYLILAISWLYIDPSLSILLLQCQIMISILVYLSVKKKQERKLNLNNIFTQMTSIKLSFNLQILQISMKLLSLNLNFYAQYQVQHMFFSQYQMNIF